jgi:hypothetical protein
VSVAGGQVGEKVGDIRPLRFRCAAVALGQEGSVLEQIRSIRRERVASQPTLELEVREESEDQRLGAPRLALRPSACSIATAMPACSSGTWHPCPCNRDQVAGLTSPGAALEQQQADQRLRVPALLDRAVEVRQGQATTSRRSSSSDSASVSSSSVARYTVTSSSANPGLV